MSLPLTAESGQSDPTYDLTHCPYLDDRSKTVGRERTRLRSELEKASIGDILFLELILDKGSVVKLGTYTPVILRREKVILEQYRGMGKVSFSLPDGMKQIPATGVLVIKTSKGKIESIKTVQLDQ